jgi:hypothetical protein
VEAADETLAHGRDASRTQLTARAEKCADELRRTDGIETTLPTFTVKRTT